MDKFFLKSLRGVGSVRSQQDPVLGRNPAILNPVPARPPYRHARREEIVPHGGRAATTVFSSFSPLFEKGFSNRGENT